MAEHEAEKSESLKKSIEIIEELEKSGTLQSLKEMSEFAAAFSKGTTDAMVDRMAGTVEKLAVLTEALSGDNMSGLIKSLDKIAELEKSGTLQSLKEMGDFAAAFSKGSTDAMIERMAGTAEKLAELTELMLNYNLKPLLDTGESFVTSGTLNDLVEFSNGVASARRMMTDGIIDRAVGTGLDLVEALLTQMDIKELIKVIDCSMHKTLSESTDPKYHKGGILSLLGMAKDPEVMSGLKFMMLLGKNLSRNLKENEQDIFIGSTFRKKECY